MVGLYVTSRPLWLGLSVTPIWARSFSLQLEQILGIVTTPFCDGHCIGSLRTTHGTVVLIAPYAERESRNLMVNEDFLTLILTGWQLAASQPKTMSLLINTLRPRQNGRLFADDTFKRIFVNEYIRIAIKISLKLFPRVKLTIFQHWFR